MSEQSEFEEWENIQPIEYFWNNLNKEIAFSAWQACAERKNAELAALREQLTKVRMEAIGWMYSYACNEMDCDRDIRITEVPKIIEQVLIDLGEESK